jgi:hypothetical protein
MKLEGYTAAEIMRVLGVSRERVRQLAEENAWRVIERVGTAKIYATEDVEATLGARDLALQTHD